MFPKTGNHWAPKKTFGANVLPEKKGRTPLSIYLEQFKSPLIYIVLAAGVISFILKEYNDVYIILAVVILDTIVGFFQEYKAEKAVAALKRLLKATATVIRDGRKTEIDVSEVVPDDLVVLVDGDRIPADGELVEAVHLTVNEAILTGESEPITKEEESPAFMGTTVFSGRGLMKVTSIGKSTELGKIAESLSEVKDEATPLQVRLQSFSKPLTSSTSHAHMQPLQANQYLLRTGMPIFIRTTSTPADSTLLQWLNQHHSRTRSINNWCCYLAFYN
jgi:Ca2+-transporting ATPase